MSSVYVRDEIKAFIAANSAETVVDISMDYRDLEEMLSDNSLDYESQWIALQFVGSEEVPLGLTANNTQGKYRETGLVFIHVINPIIGSYASQILSRSETLRNLFRGQRINDIIVESVGPINTDDGTTLQFEAGFTSGTFAVNYYRDLDL